MTKTFKEETEKLFDQAIQDWTSQGRDPEQIHAIKNFISGRGIKLKEDLNQLHEAEVAKEQLQTRVNEIEFLYQMADDNLRAGLQKIYANRGINMKLSFSELDENDQLQPPEEKK